MRKNINKASTKADIYEAYTGLLNEIKAEQSPNQKKEQTEKEILITRAAQQSKETFIKYISDLKIQLNKELEEIGEAMLSEIKQLNDIREAIRIEQETIEELYKIKAESESLEVLIQLQEIKKKEFEEEIAKKRELWDREKDETEMKLKELKIAHEKERKREEEEYSYSLQVKRRKEQDEYDEQRLIVEKELIERKTVFEKEIQEREEAVLQKEVELQELRKRVEQFPVELQKAVKEAETVITEHLKTQYETDKKLLNKEMELDIKLKEQTILTLEAKVKEMESTIKQLSGKAESSEKSVKDIALKAIESATKVQIYESTPSGRNKKESD